jgi:hypothetical protein
VIDEEDGSWHLIGSLLVCRIGSQEGDMGTQWYYTVQGQRFGPVSFEQLKQVAESGQLQASDMVWKDGMAQWAVASQVKGLIPAVMPPPPSVPPPPPLPSVHGSLGIKPPESLAVNVSSKRESDKKDFFGPKEGSMYAAVTWTLAAIVGFIWLHNVATRREGPYYLFLALILFLGMVGFANLVRVINSNNGKNRE